jgi:hypothetical protein
MCFVTLGLGLPVSVIPIIEKNADIIQLKPAEKNNCAIS